MVWVVLRELLVELFHQRISGYSQGSSGSAVSYFFPYIVKLNFWCLLWLTRTYVCFLGNSESWLNHEVADSFVNNPWYGIVRSNINCGTRKHGVALYIKWDCKYQVNYCNVYNVIVVNLTRYYVNRPPSYIHSENCALLIFRQFFLRVTNLYSKWFRLTIYGMEFEWRIL